MGFKSKKSKKGKGKGTKRTKNGKSKRVADVYQEDDGVDEKGSFEQGNDKSGPSLGKYDLDPDTFEDEEIIEDDAFNSDDYEIYGDVGKFHDGQAKAAEEEEMSEGDMEGGMTLSELLAASDSDEAPATKKQAPQDLLTRFLADDDEDEDDSDADGGDFNLGGERYAKMLSAIDVRGKKRPKVEITEPAAESEFSTTQNTGAGASLRMSDLIMGSDGAAGTRVKKQLAAMRRNKKATSLPEPLSTVSHERMTRKEGYSKAKEHVTRWDPAIRKNREADHLQFPLAAAPRLNPSTAALSVSFKPTTSLEKDLDAILDKYGYKEESIKKRELAQLEDRSLSTEEARQRQAKLSKMKSLLFHHEMKMKRIKKIKSKTYRKIRNKKRKADELSLEDLASMDPEEAAARQDKMARARIQERMSLQHRNTSKWAKRQLRYAKAAGQAGRTMIAEQLNIGHKLRQKMEDADIGFPGEVNGGEQSGSDTNSDSDDESRANRLAQLTSELKQTPKASKGVFAMRFMQRAAEKKAAQAELELKQMDKLEQEYRDEAESDSDEEGGPRKKKKVQAPEEDDDDAAPSAGRRKFLGNSGVGSGGQGEGEEDQADTGPVTLLGNSLEVKTSVVKMGTQGRLLVKAHKPAFEVAAFSDDDDEDDDDETDDEEQEEKQPAGLATFNTVAPTANNKPSGQLASIEPQDVGVLQVSTQKKKSLRFHEAVENEDTSSEDDDDDADEANPWAQGTAANVRKAARNRDKPTAQETKVRIDLNKPLLEVRDEEDEDGFKLGKQGEQAELVRQAFADGAQADEAFAKEKKALVLASLPTPEPTSVAGWGSWGGDGVTMSKRAKARKAKREAKAKAKYDAEARKLIGARKDANLKHVIISHKKDKKAMKYAVPSLPHPFSSIAEYEQQVGTPLGPEWNTLSHHLKANKPRVMVKAGNVIEPIKFNPATYKRQQKKAAAKNRAKRARKYGKVE